jgi:hypothetical protein
MLSFFWGGGVSCLSSYLPCVLSCHHVIKVQSPCCVCPWSKVRIWFLVFWAWLTSLRMMFSSSIHLPAMFVFFEARSPYVVQARLELLILLPQLPECWNSRCILPHSGQTSCFLKSDFKRRKNCQCLSPSIQFSCSEGLYIYIYIYFFFFFFFFFFWESPRAFSSEPDGISSSPLAPLSCPSNHQMVFFNPGYSFKCQINVANCLWDTYKWICHYKLRFNVSKIKCFINVSSLGAPNHTLVFSFGIFLFIYHSDWRD